MFQYFCQDNKIYKTTGLTKTYVCINIHCKFKDDIHRRNPQPFLIRGWISLIYIPRYVSCIMNKHIHQAFNWFPLYMLCVVNFVRSFLFIQIILKNVLFKTDLKILNLNIENSKYVWISNKVISICFNLEIFMTYTDQPIILNTLLSYFRVWTPLQKQIQRTHTHLHQMHPLFMRVEPYPQLLQMRLFIQSQLKIQMQKLQMEL